jgi:hypothetical protein
VAALLGNTPRTCELHYAHLMPGRTAEAVKALKAIEPWPTARPVVIADNAKHAKNTAATKAPKTIKAA